jgi:hypothetical protein
MEINMIQSIAKIFDNIDNVIIHDGENNSYDGSDFYYVYFNVSNGLIHKHIHSSTRKYKNNPLKGNNVFFKELNENQQQIIELASINQAISLIKDSSEKTFFKDDTVIVFKGRKYPKGMKFTVKGSSYYRDQFNRIQTYNLDGIDENGNSVRINALNCKVSTRGNNKTHLNDVISGLLLDPDENHHLAGLIN